MAKGLVVVSNLLPEEKLLLLLDLPGFLLFLEVCRQDHGSREMKNLHPQGQMSGPGLSLRGRTSRSRGLSSCVCAGFQAGCAASLWRLPTPTPPSLASSVSPGGVGAEPFFKDPASQTMATLFLCLLAARLLTQKPPLCPLGQANLKPLLSTLAHLICWEDALYSPKAVFPYSLTADLKRVPFLPLI